MADVWFNYLPSIREMFFGWPMDADSEDMLDTENKYYDQVPLRRDQSEVLPSNGDTVDESRDLNTLEDCLIYFSFPTLLQELDDSLERVRRRKNSSKKHEEYLKAVDKKMQKLSYVYHPDKVYSRGGSVDQLTNAQRLQTALNSTRAVLRILSREFLEDLDIDHKYAFYARFEIASLGNEDEIKRRISEVLYRTVLLSEIKQVNIIAEIRKFLTESRSSLDSYSKGNAEEFKKYRGYALYHLKKCIEGYDKLLDEFKAIDDECEKGQYGHIGSVTREMANKTLKESKILKELESTAKCSLQGQFRIFSSSEHMNDNDLILPFVYYVNTLLMCSLMQEEKSAKFYNFFSPRITDGYVHLFETKMEEMLLNTAADLSILFHARCQGRIKGQLELGSTKKDDWRKVFNNFLDKIKEGLKNRFKTEDYVEGGSKKYLLEHYAQCMNMAADIDETMLNIFKGMEKCQKTDERIKQNYEDFMIGADVFDKEIAESLEQSKLLQERVSKVLKRRDQEISEDKEKIENSTEEFVKEIAEKSTDEFEKKIAESLEQSKILQEQVSRILQRKDQEIKEEGKKFIKVRNEFENDLGEYLQQNKLLREQASNSSQTMDKVMKDDRRVEGTDEFGKEVEKCLLGQNNLLHEQAHKAFQKLDHGMEEDNNFLVEVTDELGKEIREYLDHDEHHLEDVSETFPIADQEMREKGSRECGKNILQCSEEYKLLQEQVSTEEQELKDEDKNFVKVSHEEISECPDQNEEYQEHILKKFKTLDQKMNKDDKTLFNASDESGKDTSKCSEHNTLFPEHVSDAFQIKDEKLKDENEKFPKVASEVKKKMEEDSEQSKF